MKNENIPIKIYLFVFAIAVIVIIVLIAMCTNAKIKTKKIEKELEEAGYVKDPNINQRYPEPWREPSTEELRVISIALARNNITGCGEYYLRPSSRDKNEYLVACTADGIHWEYYIVWPLTGAAVSTRGLDIKGIMLLKEPY